MTREEARDILDDSLAGLGQPAASTFTVRNRPNADASDRAWWSLNMKANERSETPRTLGYLLGYARIAGDSLLSVTGLPLDKGDRLWMDRSVVKRLERDGYLRWSGEGLASHFEITPRGALLMAKGLT
jgi:hypothetical protein